MFRVSQKTKRPLTYVNPNVQDAINNLSIPPLDQVSHLPQLWAEGSGMPPSSAPLDLVEPATSPSQCQMQKDFGQQGSDSISATVSIEIKIVMMVQMNCYECRIKALKVAARAYGVHSVTNEGKENLVTVTGKHVDALDLVTQMRKKVGYTDLVSVMEVKPKKETKEEKVVPYGLLPCSPCPCPQRVPNLKNVALAMKSACANGHIMLMLILIILFIELFVLNVRIVTTTFLDHKSVEIQIKVHCRF